MHTPSSAVNFRLSSSARAPGAPSGMTNASYISYDHEVGTTGGVMHTWTDIIAAIVKISSPQENSLELNN